jgi:hypothetical protein
MPNIRLIQSYFYFKLRLIQSDIYGNDIRHMRSATWESGCGKVSSGWDRAGKFNSQTINKS